MNNRINLKKILLFGIPGIILIIIFLLTGIFEDWGVIYLGIATWRMVRMSLVIAGGALCGVSCAAAGFEISKAKKQDAIEAKERASIEAEKEEQLRVQKAKEGFLSASKKLNEGTIRDELSNALHAGWGDLSIGINALISQSKEMDDYQFRLTELLKKNDAGKLDDAEEVLDGAEQRMLKNIRKVLNYIEIGDPSKKEDVSRVADSIESCRVSNDNMLKNTSAFLLSLTDYLNSQGNDDGREMAMLQNYKDILIQSTKH